jgi:hypothetical protein
MLVLLLLSFALFWPRGNALLYFAPRILFYTGQYSITLMC